VGFQEKPLYIIGYDLYIKSAVKNLGVLVKWCCRFFRA